MACPQVADGRGNFQVWRVDVNTLNKQSHKSRRTDSKWKRCLYTEDTWNWIFGRSPHITKLQHPRYTLDYKSRGTHGWNGKVDVVWNKMCNWSAHGIGRGWRLGKSDEMAIRTRGLMSASELHRSHKFCSLLKFTAVRIVTKIHHIYKFSSPAHRDKIEKLSLWRHRGEWNYVKGTEAVLSNTVTVGVFSLFSWNGVSQERYRSAATRIGQQITLQTNFPRNLVSRSFSESKTFQRGTKDYKFESD
jgi:hypothetical protein